MLSSTRSFQTLKVSSFFTTSAMAFAQHMSLSAAGKPRSIARRINFHLLFGACFSSDSSFAVRNPSSHNKSRKEKSSSWAKTAARRSDVSRNFKARTPTPPSARSSSGGILMIKLCYSLRHRGAPRSSITAVDQELGDYFCLSTTGKPFALEAEITRPPFSLRTTTPASASRAS